MAKSKAQSIWKQINKLRKDIEIAENNGDYAKVDRLTMQLMLLEARVDY
jgi:hypothetical protein